MQSSFQASLWYDAVRNNPRMVPPRPGQGGTNYQGTATNLDKYSQKPGSVRSTGYERALRSQWNDQGTGQQTYLCNYCQETFTAAQDRRLHENFAHGINYGR
jgi:hypothetical protein